MSTVFTERQQGWVSPQHRDVGLEPRTPRHPVLPILSRPCSLSHDGAKMYFYVPIDLKPVLSKQSSSEGGDQAPTPPSSDFRITGSVPLKGICPSCCPHRKCHLPPLQQGGSGQHGAPGHPGSWGEGQ